MAGIALILKYQWRAFWRRLIRTRHRAQFYFTVMIVLGGASVFILPARLSRAARELSAGQTTSMDAVLWTFCVLWLFVLTEDASVSLTSGHLRTFPIAVGQLLTVRILSVFCSPVALLIALGSVISLWPFFLARQTVLGCAAALLLFALAFGSAMSASHALGVAELRRRLVAILVVASVALGAVFSTRGLPGIEQARAVLAVMPPHLVSAVSVAATPSAILIPIGTLIGLCAVVGFVLFWSFRCTLYSPSQTRAVGRAAGSMLWFPGRFGGLLRKEQYELRKLVDVWPGLLLVLAVSAMSLFNPLSPAVRQSVIVLVFVMDTNMIMNGFGLDTSAGLTRYAILPLRGKEVLLVKNLGLTLLVAAQLAPLIAIAVWRSGPLEAGVEAVVAAILLLSHLAWGNLVSVTEPFKMQFYRMASSGSPLTSMAGSTIGSAPGVLVLFLLYSESRWFVAAPPSILLLTLALYLVSLNYSGRCFELRRDLIAERLS